MRKRKLHTQEWRDFQPFSDPESTPKRFQAALTRAEERIEQKGHKLAEKLIVEKLIVKVAAARSR